MISQNILKILKDNSQLNKFIENIETYEILIKTLNRDEIKRLLIEYPNFLKLINDEKEKSEKKEKSVSIICVSLVKRDTSSDNYLKLKKFRIYIDEMNQKILKILEN